MKFYTLGPKGSCHENATKAYLSFHGIENYELNLVDTIFEGVELVRLNSGSYLIQCSAHLDVHLVTEMYLGEIHVVDSFVFPTQNMALLKRKDVEAPSSLGIPEPSMGYINPADWSEIIFENTKPTVTKNLLLGKYDAGFAYERDAIEHPDDLEVVRTIGEVVTSWVVYGTYKRFDGKLIGSTFLELQSQAST